MNKTDIDMFLITNKDYLPEEKLPFIKNRLEAMDDSAFQNLSMLTFKSPSTILIISIFLGTLGIDRFMIGDTGAGVGKLLTLGGCYIWWIIDLCHITKLTKEKNYQKLAMCF